MSIRKNSDRLNKTTQLTNSVNKRYHEEWGEWSTFGRQVLRSIVSDWCLWVLKLFTTASGCIGHVSYFCNKITQNIVGDSDLYLSKSRFHTYPSAPDCNLWLRCSHVFIHSHFSPMFVIRIASLNTWFRLNAPFLFSWTMGGPKDAKQIFFLFLQEYPKFLANIYSFLNCRCYSDWH